MAVNPVPLDALDRHKLAYVSSVVGFVLEFSIPRKSRGTDMSMSLRIMDQSMTEVTVNIFLPQSENFPVFKSSGDIVLLHRFHVGMWDEEPYLKFQKHKSYFWVYSDSNIKLFVSNPPPKPPPVLPSNINAVIEQLRDWRQSTMIAAPIAYDVVLIKDLRTNTYPDLVCKVLHICKGAGKMFLYIWDGTDAPSHTVIPIFGDDYYTKTVALNTDFDQLSNSVVELFPEAGTILRVVVDDDHPAQHFHFEERWVKVRGIFYKSVDGLWEALTSNLKIRLLEQSDPMVGERESNYRNRISERDCVPMSYDPSASQVTEIISSMSDYEFSTLLHIRAAPLGIMFRCIIRSVHFGISDDGINLKITIEDPTTRVVACTPEYLKGVHLFSGIESSSEFELKFKKLIGYPENCNKCDSLSPPWFPCIIKTTLASPNDLDENRTYHIVFTKLARRNGM